MSTRRFFLLLLIMPLLVCCCSLFASNLDEVVMDNVFSTYKVGSYLFVARYGGNLNNTTPVYVGNMTVSENQTLDISGYWDSVGDVPMVVAQTVKVYLNPRTGEPLLQGFEILRNSPCVNVGTNPTITRSKDIAYHNRIIGTAIDVGCYESVPVEEN